MRTTTLKRNITVSLDPELADRWDTLCDKYNKTRPAMLELLIEYWDKNNEKIHR